MNKEYKEVKVLCEPMVLKDVLKYIEEHPTWKIPSIEDIIKYEIKEGYVDNDGEYYKHGALDKVSHLFKMKVVLVRRECAKVVRIGKNYTIFVKDEIFFDASLNLKGIKYLLLNKDREAFNSVSSDVIKSNVLQFITEFDTLTLMEGSGQSSLIEDDVNLIYVGLYNGEEAMYIADYVDGYRLPKHKDRGMDTVDSCWVDTNLLYERGNLISTNPDFKHALYIIKE